MKKRPQMLGKQKMAVMGYLFSLPFLLCFFLFTVLPVVLSLVISFTDFNMMQLPNIVWADNYLRLFVHDKIFMKALGNTLIFAAITGPGGYILSFLFAWLINELRPAVRALVTLVFYAPSIAGNMNLIWTLFFSGDSYGYLNSFLYQIGVIQSPVVWLKNEAYVVPIICFVVLWSSLGAGFLAFIAGFQGVDMSYYDAAAMDGVRNRWQELWYVTLPLMKPQLLFSAVMSITGSFGIGGVISGLAGNPSVNYCAHTVMQHLEDYGGARFELGYASAIATLLSVLMIGCNKLVQRLLERVGT